MSERTLPLLVSLLAFVTLWIAGAQLSADPSVLPAPASVLRLIWHETTQGPLLGHMLATLGRVAAAFGLSMIVGGALGVMLGRSEVLNRWVGPWITIFLNIPALVVIVLCYLWIGLNEVAAIMAVAINKTAMVTVTLREGTGSIDRQLSEMARIYRMSQWATFRHVVLPQLWPYIFSSMRNGIAIIWKIVLVAEFLGRPNGVGFQIHLYFQLFETGHVLAYAFSFVALMLVIEVGLFSTWERQTNAWARPSV